MRGALIVLGLVLAGCAGCLGEPTVRVAKITESFAFDERAPAGASDALDFIGGCGNTYDPETGRLTLVRVSDTQPTFVMLLERAANSTGPDGRPDPAAGRQWPMAAGGGGGAFGIGWLERWINERGSTGAWGQGSAFHDSHVELEWSREGAAFDGEPLRMGKVVSRTIQSEVTKLNATFGVTQTFEATYLGRLPYTTLAPCEIT